MSTIINPETGRKIKVGGKVHTDLLARSVLRPRRSSRVQSRSRSKSRGKILNPETGRMVDRNGRIGQMILSGEQKQSRPSRRGLDNKIKVAMKRSGSRRMQELARNADSLDGKTKAAVKRTGSKKYQNRPSPPFSASLHDPGTTLEGNDGNEWEVQVDKNGRHSWKRVVDGIRLV